MIRDLIFGTLAVAAGVLVEKKFGVSSKIVDAVRKMTPASAEVATELAEAVMQS